MTQENKELLLIDLCTRLPYGVKVQVADYKTPVELSHINTKNGNGRKPYCFVFAFEPERVKPYLRPMSSMTEDDIKELNKIDGKRFIFSSTHLTYHLDGEVIDYLNKKMFDYRGLIEKNLALEAPEGMYNLNEK